jgi:hypothetical protein
MASGGDIKEITWNHPVLGSGVIQTKADEENKYFTGGITTASDASMITGNGNPIWQKTRKRGYFEAVAVNDMNVGNELEKMIALSAHDVPASWTFEVNNGVVYGGSGKPVGDLEGNIGKATFTLRVEGGQFQKVSG